VRLIWHFNAYNSVSAIYGTAVELGLDNFDVLPHLSELESVWRFQFIVSTKIAITDYAQYPDALENVETIGDI
jgi:UDP-N-acetylmuramoyl-L-alanyl-D-glutamate--2,6-diaminopimelate ligase